MPFDSDLDIDSPDPEPVKKIALKAGSGNPSFVSRNEQKAKFEKKADEHFAKSEDYKQQIWDLSIKFKACIESKVLPENRGPINSNLEKEVIEKLVSLASSMNEDETQEQGIGSTALCMLLMKCMFIQRDTINKLSHDIEQLKKNK